jgi:alpha-tubulin suppressor-like RCC1 family protein
MNEGSSIHEIPMRRVASSPSRLAPFLAAALLLTLAGCGEDAESPTAPASSPALATTASAAILFRQISVGYDHTCAVTPDDRAYCWGSSQWGQLGNGTNEGPETCNSGPCSSRPVAVLGGLRFRHVNAGGQFTCGLTTDGRAYCWGRNGEGELGIGAISPLSVKPVLVTGGRTFIQVRAGQGHACAITSSNVAYCWGVNFEGQLGDGTTTGRPAPVRVLGGLLWRQLSGGSRHTCGITTTSGTYCWGSNQFGQLGTGTGASRLKPAAVAGEVVFRQVDAGFAHTCAVSTADLAYCWGSSNSGALGDGTLDPRPTPTAVAGTRRFDHVSAGVNHTCGVTLAERGVCWGANPAGQLGTGTTFRRATPTPLAVALTLTQISAGYGFTCGITTADRAYCWGDSSSGQIGDGNTTDASSLVPVPVVGP